MFLVHMYNPRLDKRSGAAYIQMLGDDMKLIPAIPIMVYSSPSHAKGLELVYFTKEELPGGKSGCWYDYPASKKQFGNVIGLGESADNAIYLVVNGKKEMIGNWKYDYQKTYHNISYSSEKYSVNIHSRVLSESQYSSQYESTLTITIEFGKETVEVFGECGS